MIDGGNLVEIFEEAHLVPESSAADVTESPVSGLGCATSVVGSSANMVASAVASEAPNPFFQDINPFADAPSCPGTDREPVPNANPFADEGKHLFDGGVPSFSLQDTTNPFAIASTNPFPDGDTDTFAGSRTSGTTGTARVAGDGHTAAIVAAAGTTLNPFEDAPAPPALSSGSQRSRGAASFAAAAVETNFRAEVYRLTKAGRRHDRRCLLLRGSVLFIFDKGSTGQVKTEVDIATGALENFKMMPGDCSLFLRVRRPRTASSLSSACLCAKVPAGDVLPTARKDYVFEFDPASLAAQFYAELLRVHEDVK